MVERVSALRILSISYKCAFAVPSQDPARATDVGPSDRPFEIVGDNLYGTDYSVVAKIISEILRDF